MTDHQPMNRLGLKVVDDSLDAAMADALDSRMNGTNDSEADTMRMKRAGIKADIAAKQKSRSIHLAKADDELKQIEALTIRDDACAAFLFALDK